MEQVTAKAQFHGTPDDWLRRLPTAEGKPFIVAFEHGTLSVEFSDDLAASVIFYGPEGGEAVKHPTDCAPDIRKSASTPARED
jgi:hypothetical protein